MAKFLDLGTLPGIVVFLSTSHRKSMISGSGADAAIFLDLGTPPGSVVFLLTSYLLNAFLTLTNFSNLYSSVLRPLMEQIFFK